METVRLDGVQLCGRESAMELLGHALAVPEWWGNNLDALHDCLTGLGRPVRLVLHNREDMESSPFGLRLLRVLNDSAAENPDLELVLE